VVETQLEMQRNGEWVRMFAGRSKNHKLTKLAPGTDYVLRVRDINHVGPGPFSAPCTFTTHRPPMSALLAPAVTLDADDIASVALAACGGAGSGMDSDIELQCRQSTSRPREEKVAVRLAGGDGSTVCTVSNEFSTLHYGSEAVVLIGPLSPGTTYEFRARRRNGSELGIFSPASMLTVAAESESEAEEVAAGPTVVASTARGTVVPQGFWVLASVLAVVLAIVVYALLQKQGQQ